MRSKQYSNQSQTHSTNALLRSLTIILIITDVAALIASWIGEFGPQYTIPIGALLVLAVISLFFLLRGNPFPAQVLLPSSLFVGLTYIIAFPPGYGLHDINLLAYAVVISLAGLTLGQRGAFAFAFLIILAVFGIGIAEMRGIIVSPTSSLTIPISPIAISIVVLAITFIQRALINLLNDSAQRARTSEREVFERNEELQTLSTKLEALVEARTSELDRANQRNEHRARQFEAIGQVSRAINQTQNLQSLLPKITEVINQQFNFYHVGIFLLDTNNEYAVLVASNSEGGKKMLARNHKLKVGQVGIVGNVAGTSVPRIALDTGADAIYFNNPDLPETRSEMALPLFRTGQQLIGVIDVQSIQPNAFGQDDIQILTTLADQVSIAISNARLYEETQKALLESETLYRRDVQSGWMKFTRAQKLSGIRRHETRSNLLLEPMDLPGALEVTRSGNIYKKQADINNKFSQMTVPMKLRGEVVGILNVKTDNNREWTVDEIDIITAIIERAALSIDNARLLDESQRRASLEQTIGEMSIRIGAGTEIEDILRTTVRELGAQISGAQISVEMGSENE
ncbi:MAG: GAF domain-containing protein [Anaerolineales bacterium]|nr:GAF domain-containing protein [Anaerolineales bacterium]